jgi:ABC-type glycerol-3-phosphate transport system permease component
MAKDSSIIFNRRNTSERVWFIAAFVIFLLYSLLVIAFFGWALKCSLMDLDEFYYNPVAWPKEWRFENYKIAFEVLEYSNTTFFGMIINSLWFSIGGAVLNVFMHCCTGYVFGKYDFAGKKLMFNVAIFTMIIPIVGSLPANYKLVCGTLQINNSPLYLITMLGGLGSNLMIMMAFFKSIDKSYAEAAFIDGATDWGVFIKIMLPMAKGPILAIGIMAVISGWNNYSTPILYLDKMPTLASGLYYFNQAIQYVDNKPAYFAGVIMSMIPALVLFSIFSNKIMGNVVMGGLKG